MITPDVILPKEDPCCLLIHAAHSFTITDPASPTMLKIVACPGKAYVPLSTKFVSDKK